MGLFDFFTGDPAKEAAENNRNLFKQNQQQDLGYLNTGYSNAQGALNSGIGAYTPLANLGKSFAGATGNYLDAIGANGAAGNSRAVSNFQSAPGYQFQLGQGLQAIDRGAATRGILNSGNTLMAEQKYGNDLANQNYQQYVSNLGSLIYPSITATSGAATGQAQGYGNLANLASSDALNRVNLNTTTTSGLANANTQEAQAKMQASGNLFNFGLNAAKAVAGFV